MAAEKRVVFRSHWLPWALLAPQVAIIVLFFFWPAGQALLQSLQQQDAFGSSVEWVGLDNFRRLFDDESYLASFRITAIFSVLVAGVGLALSLALAVFADRVVRGASVYKTLMIWPYAVAPAVAGVLWLFMFAPSIGIVSYALRKMGAHDAGQHIPGAGGRQPGRRVLVDEHAAIGCGDDGIGTLEDDNAVAAGGGLAGTVYLRKRRVAGEIGEEAGKFAVMRG